MRISNDPVPGAFNATPQRSVDDPAVARDDDGLILVRVGGSPDRLTDAVLERRNRLATGEAREERIALPPTDAVALDVIVETHPVAVRAGIVLAEAGVLGDGQVAQGRGDDLGGLVSPGILAADQDVGLHLAADRPSIAEPFGLLTTEFGKPATGPWATDDPGDRGLRFSMADEHETGHSALSLLFV